MVSYAINKKQKTLQLKIGYNRNRNRAQNPPCLRFAFSSVMYCVVCTKTWRINKSKPLSTLLYL